jgi:beta-aspartyl-peptidase (threonine type)
MLALAALLCAIPSAALTLSTSPRHVYTENDARDGHGKTESFVFWLVVRDQRNRSADPQGAAIELRSEGRVVKSLTLSGEALSARWEKPGRLSVGNSGATTGPHLHYHLMDGPRILVSDGLPARFENTNPSLPKPGVFAEATFVPGSAAPEKEESAVRRILDAQVAAWNRKDLEGYMAGYWRSPNLVFFSGGSMTRGWQATLDRYRKRYQSEGKEMGSLSFGDVSIDVLGPTMAMARGEWRLLMSGSKELHGRFTVVLQHLAEGWRIVHDHSSAD